MNVGLVLWRAHPEPNVCVGVVCECERGGMRVTQLRNCTDTQKHSGMKANATTFKTATMGESEGTSQPHIHLAVSVLLRPPPPTHPAGARLVEGAREVCELPMKRSCGIFQVCDSVLLQIASHIRVVVWPPSQRCGRGGWQHALFRYKVVGEREPLGHNPPPPTARGVCRCAADLRPSALRPRSVFPDAVRLQPSVRRFQRM
jgi:hypothetical protein